MAIASATELPGSQVEAITAHALRSGGPQSGPFKKDLMFAFLSIHIQNYRCLQCTHISCSHTLLQSSHCSFHHRAAKYFLGRYMHCLTASKELGCGPEPETGEDMSCYTGKQVPSKTTIHTSTQLLLTCCHSAAVPQLGLPSLDTHVRGQGMSVITNKLKSHQDIIKEYIFNWRVETETRSKQDAIYFPL